MKRQYEQTLPIRPDLHCTHRELPPFDHISNCLCACGGNEVVSEPLCESVLLRLAGALFESFSQKRGRGVFGARAYYGFESILWSRSRNSSEAH